MKPPRTICANSRFFLSEGPIWYAQFCGASPRPAGIDPVTGKQGYVGRNDLGMRYVSDQQFAFARDINTRGECTLYQQKG